MKQLNLNDEEFNLLYECVSFFISDPPDHFDEDLLDSLSSKLAEL